MDDESSKEAPTRKKTNHKFKPLAAQQAELKEA